MHAVVCVEVDARVESLSAPQIIHVFFNHFIKALVSCII